MGFLDRFNLDDISRKVNEVAQSAFDQGASLVGSTKNSFKANDVEKQLTKAYAELGKKYYEMIKDNPAEDEKAVVTQIKDLLAQAEFYRAEARREKGIVLCPKCGAEVAMGTMYCSSCGTVVPQPGVVQTVTCPQCNASLPEGTQFCTSCGANVSNVQPTAAQMPLGQVTYSGGMIGSPVPMTQPPITQQSFAAPVTQQSAPVNILTKQPEQPAPATVQPTFTPPAAQQPAPATVQPTFTPPAAQQSAPVNILTKQPEQPAPATVQPTFTPPAAQQPSGFPNGGPGGMTMDIDTKTVYGDTNAVMPGQPGHITLNKQ